ncbi:MAG: thiamine diphosphokinase [Candidatus Riflebacteria bacterium]|nr:thiamine diphosphokinase [Candidatus Riflebacteria bacterium]
MTEEERGQMQEVGAQILQHPRDKDETDLELAFAHVATRPDVTEIVVVGGIDGRFDHALTNVNVGCRYAVEGHPVSFVDGGYRLRPVTRYLSLVRTSRFDTVSLIPHSDVVEGVTTRGLVFPLADEPLFRSRGRGVSNRFASARASVRVRTGVLVVLETSSVS